MDEPQKKYTPIAAVSVGGQCIVLEDGRVANFSKMYDADGNETTDTSVAITAVTFHPEGAWVVLHLREYDSVTLH